uniref:Uncharacterized protein n=1 Tax=Rhizophora mucronata TaxID=61149 RepID=A0A2P2II71_RHIMU
MVMERRHWKWFFKSVNLSEINFQT